MSSGCGYNEYHYNVMNNISLSSDAYYLRSMLAYQHLFLHSSLGGIVTSFFYLGLVFAAIRSSAGGKASPPPHAASLTGGGVGRGRVAEEPSPSAVRC